MKHKLTFAFIVNFINLTSAICLIYGFIASDFHFDRIALLVFFVSYIIEIFTDRKIEKFSITKTSVYFLVMLFFFILAFIYMPFENGVNYTNIILEKRLPLIAFGIVGLLGVNRLYRLNYFLYAFVFTSITTIFYLIHKVNLHEFIFNPNRAELFTFARIEHINGHMIFNFYLNISILAVWFMLRSSWRKLSFWLIGLHLLALLITVGILMISEGRSGFTAGILLMLSIILYELFSRKKLIGIVFLFIVPIVFIVVVGSHKRITDGSLKEGPRIFLWKSGLNVFLERPITGHGINDAQVAFDVQRKLNQTAAFESYSANLKYVDCHNQYIQTGMEFGIFGLLILLFLYIYPAFIVDMSIRIFTLFVSALCIYQSVFDMFITGSFSFIFVFLMLILLRDNTIKSPMAVGSQT